MPLSFKFEMVTPVQALPTIVFDRSYVTPSETPRCRKSGRLALLLEHAYDLGVRSSGTSSACCRTAGT